MTDCAPRRAKPRRNDWDNRDMPGSALWKERRSEPGRLFHIGRRRLDHISGWVDLADYLSVDALRGQGNIWLHDDKRFGKKVPRVPLENLRLSARWAADGVVADRLFTRGASLEILEAAYHDNGSRLALCEACELCADGVPQPEWLREAVRKELGSLYRVIDDVQDNSRFPTAATAIRESWRNERRELEDFLLWRIWLSVTLNDEFESRMTRAAGASRKWDRLSRQQIAALVREIVRGVDVETRDNPHSNKWGKEDGKEDTGPLQKRIGDFNSGLRAAGKMSFGPRFLPRPAALARAGMAELEVLFSGKVNADRSRSIARVVLARKSGDAPG